MGILIESMKMRSLINLGIILCWASVAGASDKEAVPFADQIPKMMTVPNAIDVNGDNQLSTQEILNAPEQLVSLDKDGDGSLSRLEIGAYEKELPLVRSHLLVNVLDQDGDIRISPEEIKNASSSIALLDRDGDWHVSQQELTLGRPPFRTLNLPTKKWEQLRAYTDQIEGPKVPGEDPRAFEGYLLVHDAGDFNQIQVSNSTYLLDPEGQKVHEWKNDGYLPEATVSYLLPDGRLLRTLSKHHWINDKHFPVGAHSSIQLLTWEGDVLWDYTLSEPEKYSFHHDVEYMPNGNILAIRYTGFTKEEAMAMGWDPSGSENAMKRIDKEGSGLVWMDSILELRPNLENGTTEIVWQWNTWDHFVQDKYPKRQNFGDVQDRHKINVNYLDLDRDVPFNAGQLFHINTVDYNPELDMILLSSPTYGEIWFIDHSTTTKESAASLGGARGKGGSLLYRWGNNETYGAGVRDDSYLYWQHDAHWIEPGLPGAGNVLIYNNGSRRTLDDKYIKEPPKNIMTDSYTNLLEIALPVEQDGSLNAGASANIVWSWESRNRADYFSPFMSGAQRLPNGNTIFCRAYDKYVTEVTPEGETVLNFSLAGWGRLHRIYKYAPDYSGLAFEQSRQ